MLIWLIPILILLCGYYWIAIRGIHPNSKKVSDMIKSFLEDKDTKIIQEEWWGQRFCKVFESGESTMIVGSYNWPYAYGSQGKITKGSKIIYRWENLNPTYRVRRMVKNFKGVQNG